MTFVQYGEQWDEGRDKFNIPFTTEKAKKEHEKKQLYTALVEGGPAGSVVVEMCFSGTYCHVKFLDDRKRIYLRYSFDQVTGDRLFLVEIAERFYDDDSGRVSYGRISTYQEDGSVSVLEGKAGSGAGRHKTVREFKTTLDPRIHYEPIPEFGHYESITRRDRTQPPPPAA